MSSYKHGEFGDLLDKTIHGITFESTEGVVLELSDGVKLKLMDATRKHRIMVLVPVSEETALPMAGSK